MYVAKDERYHFKLLLYCDGLVIDGAGDEANFSDHNMLSLKLRLRETGAVKFGKGRDGEGTVIKSCIRKDEFGVSKFIQELKLNWSVGMGYIEMWDSLVDTQDKILRKDLTLRTGMRGKVMVVEKEWVTDELNDTKSDSERIKNQTPERPSDHGLLQSPQKDFKFPLIDLDLNSLDSYT